MLDHIFLYEFLTLLGMFSCGQIPSARFLVSKVMNTFKALDTFCKLDWHLLWNPSFKENVKMVRFPFSTSAHCLHEVLVQKLVCLTSSLMKTLSLPCDQPRLPSMHALESLRVPLSWHLTYLPGSPLGSPTRGTHSRSPSMLGAFRSLPVPTHPSAVPFLLLLVL